MKYIFLIVFFLVCNLSEAQERKLLKNRLDVSFLKMEFSSPTVHTNYSVKWVYGLGYERTFNKWSWTTSVQYGQNELNDDCKNCNDHIHGIGLLKEVRFMTGMNYTFNQFSESKWKLFTGSAAFFTWMNYSGAFEGGITGAGAAVNRDHVYLGVMQTFGVRFFPIQRFRISATCGVRLGFGQANHVLQDIRSNSGELNLFAPQISVGYVF